MRPTRLSSIQSTWDQGHKIFKVTNGRDLYSLDESATMVWPLIDGKRGVEMIVDELQDKLARDEVIRILKKLSEAKLIRMDREDFRDQVLNHYSLNLLKNPPRSPTLMSGSAGTSLYFLSEGIRRDDDKLIDKARDELLASLSGIQMVAGASSFYEGPLGILWMENLWHKKTGERLLDKKSLYPFLRSYFDRHCILPPGRFEFLYGTSGWSLISHICDRKTLMDMSAIVVRQIEDALEPNACGIGLRGVDNLERFHDPTVSLSPVTSPGFLHGVAGALTALLLLRKHGALEKKNFYLIEWLTDSLSSLDEKHPMPRTFERPEHHDRQDWCHGDGGIGLTFLLLARETGVKNYRDRGIRLIKRAISALPEKNDVGLCHGMSGKLAMALTSEKLNSGGFAPEIRQKLRDIEKFAPELIPQVTDSRRPLIVSAMGAAIARNAVEDIDFISFFYPA